MNKVLLYVCAILSIFSVLTQGIAAEKSRYDFSWLDKDKEVYVLQNRKFRKDSKFFVSALGGVTTSGAFVDATVLQGRAGFFFAEEWGVELLYSKNSSEENDTAKAVFASSQVEAFVRKVQNYYGGMVLWSPFYAKINTFNQIVYFDWIFGLGAATLTDQNNANKVDTTTVSDVLIEESHTGLMWEAGMRFYISPSWSLRMNLTTIHYSAVRSSKNAADEKVWNSNYDMTVGVNYTF